MCYVILSRIVCIGQLLLLTFNPCKIYCNEEAKAEALSIKRRALNLQFDKWNQNQCNTFKISSLNAQSLSKHFEDLQDDHFPKAEGNMVLTWPQQYPNVFLTPKKYNTQIF